MADNEIIKATLNYYQQHGWNIIPLYKDAKKPALEKGEFERIFDHRLELDDLIQRLKNPDVGNIGLSIGHTSNLWVLDFDDPSLIEKYKQYQSPLRQKTPSGGQHWFYLPVGQSIGNGLIEKGLEYYTHKHNIVLAPSYVKAERDGRKYEGKYEWIEFGKPSLFPLSLLSNTTETNNFSLSKYTRQEILELLNYTALNGKFPSGQHNDTLFYGSFILACDGNSQEFVLNMMLGYDRNDPTPQGDHVVRSAVERAFEAAEKSKLPIIEIKDDINVGIGDRDNNWSEFSGIGNSFSQESQKEVISTKPYLQSYFNFVQEFYDSRANWLVDEWLVKENFTIIAGQPQSYKTYLALDLAWSICTGNDFLGRYPVRQSGKVLIVQMEDSYKNFSKRLLAIDNRYYGLNPTEITDEWIKFNRNVENQPIIPRNYRFSFENETSLLQLDEMIKRINPVMVIIDPLRSASEDVDKFFAKVGKQIDDQLRPLRDKYNVGFTVVHHATKNGGSGQQKIFGSNIMIGAFESKLLLERVNQNDPSDSRVKVDRYFKEEGNQLPIQLTFKVNYQNTDMNEQYSVAVDEMSEEERKIDTISKYLIVNGPQKIGTLFDEYGEQFGYARATSLNYFMEKHEDKFVRSGTKWSVTPDKGE